MVLIMIPLLSEASRFSGVHLRMTILTSAELEIWWLNNIGRGKPLSEMMDTLHHPHLNITFLHYLKRILINEKLRM